MATSANDDSKAICSVTEMAHKLGLSRQRLYQLVKKGVLPPPVRPETGRPYYTPDLQETCVQIRRTQVGLNSQPAIFYKSRKGTRTRKPEKGRYADFMAALEHMGIQVSVKDLERAMGVLYPTGIGADQDPNEVVSQLVRRFT